MTDELVFVRCITCGKVLANKSEKYQALLEKGVSIQEALNEIGLTRPCCRIRMQNPFKVVDRNVQSQLDINKMFESNFDTLSVSNDSEASSASALAALNDVTAMTIIPEEESEFELPPIPSIPKSSLMTPSGSNVF